MWGVLSTSHAPNTANDNLVNKPYFCLGLLCNLSDLLIPDDAISSILGIVYPLSPLQDVIPLGALDFFLLKQTFFSFDVLLTPLENGCLCKSEADATSLSGPSFTCSSDYTDVRVFFYSMEQFSSRVLEFLWYIPQYLG